VPVDDVHATINAALSDNIKRYDEAGNVIPGPLVTGIKFDYFKKDAQGQRTVKERATGYPAGWAKGGDGKNLLVYKTPQLLEGPHVYVVSFMSNVIKF